MNLALHRPTKMPDETTSTKPKPFIFVLMPFEARFDDIYKFGIKGAAEDAGAYAERVDEQIFVEGMLDRIFNQINKADVIVADMTGMNPNVFYEVGYAHALDKVVLLITQRVDDIPFDLKHRQHVVYSGSIGHLRSELGGRIRWAVGEAERRNSRIGPERISVRLNGVQLHSGFGGASPSTPAEIAGKVQGTMFQLPLHVWNDSERGVLEISHVYLFSQTDAHAVPIEPPLAQGFASYRMYAPISPLSTQNHPFDLNVLPGAIEIEAFTANPVDAPDGLTRQFRLHTQFGSIPPRAIEAANLHFLLKAPKAKSAYRLRFHTRTRYLDFSFTFDLTQIAEESS
jgi:hypothetical protein